ncbi:MAG: aminopeptidase [Flavobacterium sp.]
MVVSVDTESHTLTVSQQLTYVNKSAKTLNTIVLNDWNNAYSDRNSLLGERFSDEFVRSFHLAKAKERGNTNSVVVTDAQNSALNWTRPKLDLVEVTLNQPLAPQQQIVLNLNYVVKLPSDQFTKYGYDSNNNLTLKNWFLAPARFSEDHFVRNSNANLDDIVNGLCDYDLEVHVRGTIEVTSDLDEVGKNQTAEGISYSFSGQNRNDFSLYVNQRSDFYSFKNARVDVLTDLKDTKLDGIQKAIIIDRVVNFVGENIGDYPFEKMTVSQVDYERNPFYGLNQLPSFLSPFPNDFLYELKFLKTYTNNFLKNSLHLDGRKDNWVYDAIQMYVMMKYIDEYRPESKMMGSLSKWKLLRSYYIINLQFNEQYSYYYMLMARKNLDQPLGDSKETLIRFNEKIASKYRAGLSLKYLDNFLSDSIVPRSIKLFYRDNIGQTTDRYHFENQIEAMTNKKVEWFFRTVIESRDIIDYKFGEVTKTADSITMNIKNRTGTTVPIPVYGIKDKKIVFKEWFENIQTDSTFTVKRNNADKIVLNYNNEVPEFNLRNNWRSLKVFFGNDRPYKFAFLKDLENPHYNQIIYVPTLTYNYYDGLSPGIKFSNKTMLDKPFIFDLNPVYSTKTQSLSGSAGFSINQYRRDSRLFNIRYGMSGSYYHYAPDAAYLKLSPSVNFLIREKDFRDNKKQGINLRYSIVRKDHSEIVIDSSENYAVLNARYSNSRTEINNHFNYNTDVQVSSEFSKLSGELQYRKLFDNNRQFNIRFFAGTFVHNNTDSDYFDFGLSNPNDYLFDYNFFGRSEETGLLSQQIILAEGAFKSKLAPKRANQWMATTNVSFSIWNWIEAYGDAGFVKNHHNSEKFLYDSGIRLNLVTDYFELYFPVYSNNGWEIAQSHYNEKIRFIATFSPKTLINLFTRKWF